MTDNEQRAHDIAVAFASFTQKANFDTSIQNGIAAGKDKIDAEISVTDFLAYYQVAYQQALAYLNTQK